MCLYRSISLHVVLSRYRIQVEKNLLYYLEPKYNLFFDRIHQLPNGLKLLADMRADLLVKKTNHASLMIYYI